MRQIGFNNFRKFQSFPQIDLSPISIFVGENNAGKSTVVKAILALLDFLNSRYFEIDRNKDEKAILEHQFFFNRSYFAHIGTFKRALYNKADENCISFTITLDDYKIEVEVTGDKKDEEAISGRITKMTILMLLYNVELTFDFLKDNIHAVFHHEPSTMYIPGGEEFGFRIYGEKEFKSKDYFKSFSNDVIMNVPITGQTGMIGGPLIGILMDRFTSKIETIAYPEEMQKRARARKRELKPVEGLDEEALSFINSHKEFLCHGSFRWPLMRFYDVSDSEVEYIYAHAVTQTVIYSAKDTNDYFVKTIHEFANQRVGKTNKIHGFITQWMQEFNIGVDYEINSVGGEAHIVKIVSKDGEKVNLADKGMGSIQLMILLFRLATKMSELRLGLRNSRNGTTIIVEEPEQNLHPMLQSKLADLFYNLNQEYGFKFIIETHSEYLIRKTQVIVGDNFKTEEDLKKNPFKVYYFPAVGIPYDMGYTTSGLFKEKFGDGFINEAGRLHMTVLKNSKDNK